MSKVIERGELFCFLLSFVLKCWAWHRLGKGLLGELQPQSRGSGQGLRKHRGDPATVEIFFLFLFFFAFLSFIFYFLLFSTLFSTFFSPPLPPRALSLLLSYFLDSFYTPLDYNKKVPSQ